MQFSILAIFTALVAGQGAFAVVVRQASEGKACTASIQGTKQNGVCNAIGQCSVNVPPNENFRVKSNQCA